MEKRVKLIIISFREITIINSFLREIISLERIVFQFYPFFQKIFLWKLNSEVLKTRLLLNIVKLIRGQESKMTDLEKNETEVLVAKLKVNKVRTIITDSLEKSQEDFDEYLCYGKYGSEKFKKGDYTLDAEDKEMQRRLHSKSFTMVLKSLLQDSQEVKPVIEELSKNDSDDEVRSWAKALLAKL